MGDSFDEKHQRATSRDRQRHVRHLADCVLSCKKKNWRELTPFCVMVMKARRRWAETKTAINYRRNDRNEWLSEIKFSIRRFSYEWVDWWTEARCSRAYFPTWQYIYTWPPLSVVLEKLNLNSERDGQNNVRVYGCTSLAVQEEQFDDYHSMCVLLLVF